MNGNVAADGKVVTDGMIEGWESDLERDERLSGWANVGDVVEGEPTSASLKTITPSSNTPAGKNRAFEDEALCAELGEWHRVGDVKTERIVINLDMNSYKWILRESERTGLPIELVATTLLRKSCAEKVELGIGQRGQGINGKAAAEVEAMMRVSDEQLD